MNPRVTDVVMKTMNAVHKTLYKVSSGRLGNKMVGAPVLFLTTTGRKTGQPRTVSLLYLADGDRKLIVASKGGDNRHPVWYLNLQASPEATIEVRGQKEAVRARVLSPEEKAAVWPRLVEMYKGYEGYQRKADRDIPVIALTKA